MPLAEAVRLAQERGLDLVEVNPRAEPPVAKIVDWGQYSYQLEKTEQRSKKKHRRIEVKGIRLTFKMGEHDFQLRLDQAKKFLERGDKVRVDLRLRGREQSRGELGMQRIKKFLTDLGSDIVIEQPLTRQGPMLSMMVAKKG